jgi:UDP-N-acetylmuramoyl-L-alanyl-D-glutamate--2,6-diaminopimelate ligase
MAQDRLVCVVGCGGDRDRAKRPLMGDIAAREADVAVFTADNSRSESTEQIIEQMVDGVSAPDAEFRVEPDRRNAIRLGIELAHGPRSLVAVCGRGCERFQKIAGERIPFDDRLVARQLMEQMPLQRRITA